VSENLFERGWVVRREMKTEHKHTGKVKTISILDFWGATINTFHIGTHDNKYFVVKCFCFNAPKNTAQIDCMIVRLPERSVAFSSPSYIHLYISVYSFIWV